MSSRSAIFVDRKVDVKIKDLKKKRLVIRIDYGGLGDNLLWSPIPRLAKQRHHYELVFISNHSKFRNPETKHFVWGLNPYVDGFTNENAPVPSFNSVEKGKNILDAMVDFVGFPDDGVRFREPELYYKPNFLPEYADSIIYDPNYISMAGHPSSELVRKFFEDRGIQITHQMKPNGSNSAISGVPSLDIKGLKLLSDVIFSCKGFYCLTSGTATLACALSKPVTVLHTVGTNPMFHHSKRNTYIQLD